MTAKNNIMLWGIIIFLIAINFTLIVRIDSYHNSGKRFTYTDGITLYKICNKNGGDKTSLINRMYGKKETDFRDFLLGK